jgi:hypothetical protein
MKIAAETASEKPLEKGKTQDSIGAFRAQAQEAAKFAIFSPPSIEPVNESRTSSPNANPGLKAVWQMVLVRKSGFNSALVFVRARL